VRVVANAPTPPSTERSGSDSMPRSVRFVQGLLWLQSGIWACCALLFLVWAVTVAIMALTGAAYVHRNGGEFLVAAVGFFPVGVVTGGFAAAKFILGRSLPGRRELTRKTAIGVEVAMASLGALITAGANASDGLPAVLVTVPALVGGGLSLAAAVGLMRRPARQFFADPRVARNSPPDSNHTTAFSADGSGRWHHSALRPA
jgi:hypothetical protein